MSQGDTVRFSVVIPVVDENESLNELYERLIGVMEKMAGGFELIFVDDGSKDASFSIMKKLYEKDNRVKVLQFRRNFGKSAALTAGVREAKGKCVITIDGDLQDVPEEIPLLVSKLDEDYDLVSSWRFDRKDAVAKRAFSRLYNKALSLLSGIRIHDFNSGLKCYREDVFKEISITGGMHRYIPVLAGWKGFKVSEVKVDHHARKYGHTKYPLTKVFGGFFDFLTTVMITKYSGKPFHVFGLLGLVITFIGFVINAYVSVEWFFGKWIKNRPLLILGVLLMIVGFQIVFFGLLSEIVIYSSNRESTYSVKRKLNRDDD